MNMFIPFDKMSKRQKKELAKTYRGTWGAMNPVTRKPENPKAYNRKKIRREDEDFNATVLFF